jgi:sulfonate transport system substrate-binding protein
MNRIFARPMSSTAARVATSGLTKLRVGGVPEHFNTPFHIASSSGKFAAAGLHVEWTDFPGGTGAMMGALRNDEIDVAIALTEGIVADLHRDNPSKLLGTYVASPLCWGVHVKREAEQLQSMADLDGATYAVSRMGSGSHLMACVDAHARGADPKALLMEVVGSLDGARKALRDGQADVFLWEKYTTKFLVDSGEWRRIGEVPTPWPCFSFCASDLALGAHGQKLATMLDVVRAEAAALRASPECASIIGVMYGQKDDDVREWLESVRWSSQPVVSHSTLRQIMGALVDAGVLSADELRPPAELLSTLTTDGEPEAV